MSDDFRHYEELDAGDEWGTPPWIVEPLAESLDGFDLDPASGAEPRPYADERYTIDDDGLASPWFGDVWLNPPYGRKHNPAWGRKVTKERSRDAVDSITVLIPNNAGTSWYGEYYANADYKTELHTRVDFIGAGTDTATFDSAIVSFGEFPDEYIDTLRNLGSVWVPFAARNASLRDYCRFDSVVD